MTDYEQWTLELALQEVSNLKEKSTSSKTKEFYTTIEHCLMALQLSMTQIDSLQRKIDILERLVLATCPPLKTPMSDKVFGDTH